MWPDRGQPSLAELGPVLDQLWPGIGQIWAECACIRSDVDQICATAISLCARGRTDGRARRGVHRGQAGVWQDTASSPSRGERMRAVGMWTSGKAGTSQRCPGKAPGDSVTAAAPHTTHPATQPHACTHAPTPRRRGPPGIQRAASRSPSPPHPRSCRRCLLLSGRRGRS